MMNLIARTPSFVSSSTSVSPRKTWYGYQDHGKSVVVDDRLGQPDKISWRMLQHVRLGNEEVLLHGTAQSVRYGEPLRDRLGQPDNDNSQEAANSKNFISGSDATEFVIRVNDQVRKREKMSNVADSCEEH